MQIAPSCCHDDQIVRSVACAVSEIVPKRAMRDGIQESVNAPPHFAGQPESTTDRIPFGNVIATRLRSPFRDDRIGLSENLARLASRHIMIMNPDMYWGSGIGVLGVMCEESSMPVIPVVLLVDDCARVKAELRPEWPCRILQNTITPFHLTTILNELLHQPQFAEI